MQAVPADRGTVVIAVNRAQLSRRLLFMFGGVALVLVYLALFAHRFTLYLFAPIVALLVYYLWPFVRGFITGVAFTITDRGIVDEIGELGAVAWFEIERVRIETHGGVTGVALKLYNPEGVLERLPWIRRMALGSYVAQGKWPLLYAGFADGGPERLMPLIEHRIGQRTASPEPAEQGVTWVPDAPYQLNLKSVFIAVVGLAICYWAIADTVRFVRMRQASVTADGEVVEAWTKRWTARTRTVYARVRYRLPNGQARVATIETDLDHEPLSGDIIHLRYSQSDPRNVEQDSTSGLLYDWLVGVPLGLLALFLAYVAGKPART